MSHQLSHLETIILVPPTFAKALTNQSIKSKLKVSDDYKQARTKLSSARQCDDDALTEAIKNIIGYQAVTVVKLVFCLKPLNCLMVSWKSQIRRSNWWNLCLDA